MSIKEKLDHFQEKKEDLFNDYGLRYVFGEQYKDMIIFDKREPHTFAILFEEDRYFYLSTFDQGFKDHRIRRYYDGSSKSYLSYQKVEGYLFTSIQAILKENEEKIHHLQRENDVLKQIMKHPNYRLKTTLSSK
jgi:hypothetical protein